MGLAIRESRMTLKTELCRPPDSLSRCAGCVGWAGDRECSYTSQCLDSYLVTLTSVQLEETTNNKCWFFPRTCLCVLLKEFITGQPSEEFITEILRSMQSPTRIVRKLCFCRCWVSWGGSDPLPSYGCDEEHGRSVDRPERGLGWQHRSKDAGAQVLTSPSARPTPTQPKNCKLLQSVPRKSHRRFVLRIRKRCRFLVLW